MSVEIRLARESDASGILAIYAPIVEQTAISFELAPPSEDEVRKRIRSIQSTHAWLTCEKDGMVAGYAYASKFRPREAYLWTTEVTVYVHQAHRRRGYAKALYLSLFDILRLQGFCTAIAVIALPNPASVQLHEQLGFTEVGVIRSAGYKLNEWHDTGWWQLELQQHPLVRSRPIPVVDLPSGKYKANTIG